MKNKNLITKIDWMANFEILEIGESREFPTSDLRDPNRASTVCNRLKKKGIVLTVEVKEKSITAKRLS